jgi:hypothetical protein
MSGTADRVLSAPDKAPLSEVTLRLRPIGQGRSTGRCDPKCCDNRRDGHPLQLPALGLHKHRLMSSQTQLPVLNIMFSVTDTMACRPIV